MDIHGNAYVTGITSSPDFPTKNAFQQIYAGGSADAFVAKFDADSDELVYSTYLGGSDFDEAMPLLWTLKAKPISQVKPIYPISPRFRR